jgi:4-phospho-D-threonate 3-dehydrogenase / 4-phospho-D-erythronate 3-dehydrogenase
MMDKSSPRSGAPPVVAITMGDPAGVGPELCLRALREPSVLRECIPVVFGDAGVMERVAAQCALPAPEHTMTLAEWTANPHTQTPAVVDCAAIDAEEVSPGVVAEACGRAAYTYIETAIHAALRGEVAAVATAPIHKEALHKSGVPYPGHTEIFAALTGAERACMMLASDEITTSFVTTHIGLIEVSARISEERVLEVIELTAEAMQRLRGEPPKIAVCGLNPHAGEHGLFGAQEEERFIAPAIAAARSKGIDVEGPLPPDAAFVATKRPQVDAYVCMYHDQGHIPFKMLAFDTGVNITLGLPIIRTSVDHGTAFDIAWTGRANPTSLYQAALWAARLASGATVSAK